MMSKAELEAEIERLAPFHHKLELPHGLSTFLPGKMRREIEKTRVSNLIKHAFPPLLDACGGSLEGKRVLDVACNCGGFSFAAAEQGAEHVLGFDVVDHYLEQAALIQRANAAERVEFRKLDIEKLDPNDIGHFDVTFCFGILYHLENPVLAMKKLADVSSDIMLVDTTVMKDNLLERLRKRPLWAMNFPAAANRDSEDSSTSLWRAEQRVQFKPNVEGVVQLLKFLGFSSVERIKPTVSGLEKRFYQGRRVAFLARR